MQNRSLDAAPRRPVVLRSTVEPLEADAEGYEAGTSDEQKVASDRAEARERRQEAAAARLAGDDRHAAWAAELARRAQLAAVGYALRARGVDVGRDAAASTLARSQLAAGRPGGGPRRAHAPPGGDDPDLADEPEPPLAGGPPDGLAALLHGRRWLR